MQKSGHEAGSSGQPEPCTYRLRSRQFCEEKYVSERPVLPPGPFPLIKMRGHAYLGYCAQFLAHVLPLTFTAANTMKETSALMSLFYP